MDSFEKLSETTVVLKIFKGWVEMNLCEYILKVSLEY